MKIITYYDRHFRTWVAFYVDDEGNQVGECEYHVNKQQCVENLKRFSENA